FCPIESRSPLDCIGRGDLVSQPDQGIAVSWRGAGGLSPDVERRGELRAALQRLRYLKIEYRRIDLFGDHLGGDFLSERDSALSAIEQDGAMAAIHTDCGIQPGFPDAVRHRMADEGCDAHYRDVILPRDKYDGGDRIHPADEV